MPTGEPIESSLEYVCIENKGLLRHVGTITIKPQVNEWIPIDALCSVSFVNAEDVMNISASITVENVCLRWSSRPDENVDFLEDSLSVTDYQLKFVIDTLIIIYDHAQGGYDEGLHRDFIEQAKLWIAVAKHVRVIATEDNVIDPSHWFLQLPRPIELHIASDNPNFHQRVKQQLSSLDNIIYWQPKTGMISSLKRRFWGLK